MTAVFSLLPDMLALLSPAMHVCHVFIDRCSACDADRTRC